MAERLIKNQPSETEAIGGLDPDVAEAAALAHDLGHPPYGHIAEQELNDLAREEGLADGFEGNAQSFRIVANLAVGDAITSGDSHDLQGLNLTRATLNGILKYPWLHGANAARLNKWGAYETERKIFEWAREGIAFGTFSKSAEAELMDWADDITYAVHDLIDFFCAGQIPLDRLADNNDTSERYLFFTEVFTRCTDLAAHQDLRTIFQKVLQLFPLDRRYTGILKQRTGLWQFSTVLISRYVNAIRLVAPESGTESLVRIESYARDEIRVLKELTWHYVILNNELATVQYGHRQAVRTVFKAMIKAAEDDKTWRLFPPSYQEYLSAAQGDVLLKKRVVVDYVAGMTEHEIARIHACLTGRTA